MLYFASVLSLNIWGCELWSFILAEGEISFFSECSSFENSKNKRPHPAWKVYWAGKWGLEEQQEKNIPKLKAWVTQEQNIIFYWSTSSKKSCVTKNKDKKLLETRAHFKALFDLIYRRKNLQVFKRILNRFLYTKRLQCKVLCKRQLQS